jgi:hypothetical protein
MTARAFGAVVLWVLLGQPVLVLAACAPAARSIFPASGTVGTDVVATVTGEALNGATVTVLGDLGLTAAVQTTSALQVTLHLVSDPTATPGERILTLETPGGSAAVSFTVNPAGGPIVDGVSPPLVATLGLPLDVTVTGSNLSGITASSIAISGSGVSVAAANPAPDGTSLALTFAVDAAAALGTHAVTLSNGVGSVLLELYVQRPAPSVTLVSPAAGDVGATVPITITGTNLTGAALVITGSGVTVGDVVTPDDQTITATLTIASTATASTEPRLLIVTTESGQTTIEFFVVAAGTPTVTGVVPGAGEPGQTVAVTLHGLHLTGTTGVTTGTADLTAQNVTTVDDQTVTLDVVVAVAAATAVDHTLTLVPGGGTGTFRVIPAGTPFFNAARPPFGNRGSLIIVKFDGVNLGTTTSVVLSGPKITESNPLGLDARTAQVTLDIDPTAPVGFRDVTLTTTGGMFTRSPGFRVNVPGQVPSVTDVTPTLLQPGTTTSMTVTGSNLTGGSVLVTGPGATVTNVAVDPTGTTITFDLTLAADAPAETRAVIVVTQNGTARCNIASDPTPPPFTPAKLVKPGALFTVDSTAFRLFVFEFSINDLFIPSLRTAAIPNANGSLTLDRQQTVQIEEAFREAHKGAVRVRAVTATNRIATSTAMVIRR